MVKWIFKDIQKWGTYIYMYTKDVLVLIFVPHFVNINLKWKKYIKETVFTQFHSEKATIIFLFKKYFNAPLIKGPTH